MRIQRQQSLLPSYLFAVVSLSPPLVVAVDVILHFGVERHVNVIHAVLGGREQDEIVSNIQRGKQD